ncbi:MAG: WecB/TagA/CpsF family glycosyltransferase [Planctomycetota bacterium]
MPLILAVFVAVAAVAWLAFAQRGSLLVGCAGFVAVGYVLGPELFSVDVGPVSLTADRLALVALIAAFTWQWRLGWASLRATTTADWLLFALVAYLTLRCATTPPADLPRPGAGPWWRLATAFWAPAAIYLVARNANLTERSWRAMLACLTALGAYLAFTALAEATEQWWAVFPRYISDPTLGTHFGRARGPALMSASLGVFLTICGWAAWMLWPRSSRGWQLALAALMIAMATSVYFTYTRSTWLGLAAGAVTVPLLQLRREWRVLFLSVALLASVVGVAAIGSNLTNLGRDDTDGSAEHSVYQRASFVYVSMRMFRDAPIFGCGFSRFYDKKLAYLADRSQQIELESLRPLDHHNTLLSLLTETGLVGFSLYAALLVAWAVAAWRLSRDPDCEAWVRSHGVFALAAMIAYAATALFHDMTLSPSGHWLLFLPAGVASGLTAQLRTRSATRSASGRSPLATLQGAAQRSFVTPQGVTMDHAKTIRLFGMRIDAVDMPQAIGRVLSWCSEPRTNACRYVVTPNVDHAVMYQENDALRDAYAGASLVLADGAPVVLASRILRRRLPARVAGSDLAPRVFASAASWRKAHGRPLRVFLLGAAPGVARRAKSAIMRRWSGVEVVGTLSPPLGFENDPTENEEILGAITAARPDLLLVGLGAPKQELWVHRFADRIDASAALCIGATIDFLAGEKRRAPRWMRQVGLEWMHRLASEPKRLAGRYLKDAWVFPQLLWREMRVH